MLYYLVASTTCCMVGIEQCRVFSVRRSLRAAFEKEFAGRILLMGSSALSWPVQYCVYKRAPALFLHLLHLRNPYNPLISDKKEPRSNERGQFIGIPD